MKRNPAKKIWIKALKEGEYSPSSGGYDPNKLVYDGEEYIRVKLLGTVIDRFEGDDFSSITIKDDTGEIQVRFFQEDTEWTENISEGDLVRVIGKVREREDETVLNGEIVKKLDNPAWLELHQKQLENIKNKETKIEETEI